MPYEGGLSRGDTPQRQIPTVGAGGTRNPPPQRIAENNKGCPFYVDETLQFAPRSAVLTMGVLQPEDAPRGLVRYLKDYDRSLITEDLPRAQPVLAHPTSGAGDPVPWRYIQKPDLPDIPKAHPKTLYPAPRLGRPLDLSLTTSDIPLAQPPKDGTNSEGRFRTDRVVDPLWPIYQVASSEAPPPPTRKANGRDTLDVSDIEGTSRRETARRHHGDPLKVEAEFRTPFYRAAAQGPRRPPDEDPLKAQRPGVPGEGRPGCVTPRERKVSAFPRGTDPQAPRYQVPVAVGACTSLHARWAEEHSHIGREPPPTQRGDIGPVDGATPRTRIRDNGEPQLSLDVQDIEGARSAQRVGGIPFSIWGPRGNRPPVNPSLNTSDIEGAQADTIPQGPRPTALRSARLRAAGAAAAVGRPEAGGGGGAAGEAQPTPRGGSLAGSTRGGADDWPQGGSAAGSARGGLGSGPGSLQGTMRFVGFEVGDDAA